MISDVLFLVSLIITVIFTLYLLWHTILKILYFTGFNFYDFEDEYPSLFPLIILEVSSIILTSILYLIKIYIYSNYYWK